MKINNRAKKIIEGNYAAFATVDKNRKPNVIAVSCVKVIGGGNLIITDNFMKHTRENLKENNNVCLAVWNNKEEGYKLIGKAKYFSSGKWLKFVKQMPENKGFPAKGAILVTVLKLTELGS